MSAGTLLPVSALPVDSPAGIALGAKPLKPERSVNYSVGFVFNAMPRFNLTVDAYQIRIKDRILLSSTLQGTTVISVLQAAGITSRRGLLFLQLDRHAHARAGHRGTYKADLGKFGTANLSLSANFNETVFTRVDAAPAVLAASGLVLIGRDRQGRLHAGHAAQQVHRQCRLGKGPRRAEPARHALWLGHTGQRQRHRARCLDRPPGHRRSGCQLSPDQRHQAGGGRQQSVQHLSQQIARLAAGQRLQPTTPIRPMG
jgi:hypothetical protein